MYVLLMNTGRVNSSILLKRKYTSIKDSMEINDVVAEKPKSIIELKEDFIKQIFYTVKF